MFIKAIQYIANLKQYKLDAVHIAIALTYYGLLRIPVGQRASDPTSFSETVDNEGHKIAHFNFTQLIHYHAHIISQKYAKESMIYLFQICLNTDLNDDRANNEQIVQC